MPEVMRQAPGVVAIVGELVPRRMTEHVRVDLKRQLGSNAGPLDHPEKPSSGHWCPGFSHKDVRA